MQRRSDEKILQGNCTDAHTNYTRLKNAVAATLKTLEKLTFIRQFSWFLWNPRPIHLLFSTYSLSRLIHFVRSNSTVDTSCQTPLQEKPLWITMA